MGCLFSLARLKPTSQSQILGGGYMRDWRESITGLKKVGFADEDLLNIVGILAAILHLGDVAFAESANVGDGGRDWGAH